MCVRIYIYTHTELPKLNNNNKIKQPNSKMDPW